MLLTAFYAYLIPIASVINIAGLLIHYAIEKFNLLNRNVMPQPIGDAMNKSIVNFFVEFIIVIFSVKK
jgi:hypothetical protein